MSSGSDNAVRAGDVFAYDDAGRVATVMRTLPGGRAELRIEGIRDGRLSIRVGDSQIAQIKTWKRLGRAEYQDGTYAFQIEIPDMTTPAPSPAVDSEIRIFCEYNDRYGNGPSISFSFVTPAAEAAAHAKLQQIRALGAGEASWPLTAVVEANATPSSGPDAASNRLAGTLAQLGEDLRDALNFNDPDQRLMLRESLLASHAALEAYERGQHAGDVPRTFFVEGYWDGADYVQGFVDATGLPAKLFEHLDERYQGDDGDFEPLRFYLKDVAPAALVGQLEKCGAFRAGTKMAEVIEADTLVVKAEGTVLPIWEQTDDDGKVQSIAVRLPAGKERVEALYLDQLDDELTVGAKP